MKTQLKIEFLLPSTHNTGEDVEFESYIEIKKEIVATFGGISTHPGTVAGIWQGEDKIYYDNCYRFEIAVHKSDETKAFFVIFKEKLKKIFRQQEIYMTAVEMERF